MSVFFQKTSALSQTEIIYNSVSDIAVGTSLTFEQLTTMSGFEKARIQMLLTSVNKRLLINHKKMLINIRGIGYKMATHTEQLVHIVKRQKKGDKQFRIANTEASNVDTKKMTPEEKNQLQLLLARNEMKLRVTRKYVQTALNANIKATKANEAGLDVIEQLQNDLAELKKAINK